MLRVIKKKNSKQGGGVSDLRVSSGSGELCPVPWDGYTGSTLVRDVPKAGVKCMLQKIAKMHQKSKGSLGWEFKPEKGTY